MMSARRRIVVTGGAGFIGSTLADRLLYRTGGMLPRSTVSIPSTQGR